jgi:hypothetical protein
MLGGFQYSCRKDTHKYPKSTACGTHLQPAGVPAEIYLALSIGPVISVREPHNIKYFYIAASGQGRTKQQAVLIKTAFTTVLSDA